MTSDLHIHSVNSDGSLTPAEIISEAARLGLAVALTDHNTTSGLTEFLSEAEKQGVTAAAGIELSTAHNGHELHLLGLFISPEHFPLLEKTVAEFHELKEKSNIELAERLRRAGYDVDYGSVKRRNPHGNANRAHFARELMEKGYVGSVREAFDTLLGEGMGFYIPPDRLLLTDAIRLLRSIKAVPVIAHPLHDLEGKELRALLPEAIDAGLLGIEVLHSSYDEDKIAAANRIAEEFGLHKSGGSDFHGSAKPDIKMGVGKGNLVIPIEFYNDLLQLQQSL